MQSRPTCRVSFSKLHQQQHGGGPVIDRDVFSILEELADEDDPDLVSELVDLFLVDSAERMAQVSEGSVQADAGAIRGAAHALKSSSANVGALRFSQICASLEAAARGDDLEGLADLVQSALEMYIDVRTAFTLSSDEPARTRD